MSRRLYLGRLPMDARQEDVSKMFEGYGTIVDCRVMSGKGFGFVEFESSRDAEDAVTNFNGKEFMGQSIVVEFAKEARRREPRDDDRGPPRSRRPPGIRIIVSGVSRDTSWQDLKDFGREAGSVSFADIDRDSPGDGILEYYTREDADAAVKSLDGRDLRGNTVKVALAGDRDYRKDSRPPRRDDRGYRERSRSPRRDYERRRSPPRRDYEDDRRYDDRSRYESRGGGGGSGGGYEDRRGGREDDRGARRRDDYDDRRAPPPADGAEWSR